MRDEGTSQVPEFGAPVLNLIRGRVLDIAPSGPSTPEALNLLDHVSPVVSMTLSHDGTDSTLMLRTSEVKTPRMIEPKGLLDVMRKGFRLVVERIVGSANPTTQESAMNVILPALEVPAPEASPERVARRGLMGALLSRFGGGTP